MNLYDRIDRWLDHCEWQRIPLTKIVIHPDDLPQVKRDKDTGDRLLYRGLPIVTLRESAAGF